MKFRFSDSGRVWEPMGAKTIGAALTSLPRLRANLALAWVLAAAALLLWLITPDVQAQAADLTSGLFNAIDKAYLDKAKSWEQGFRSIARSLFGGLAVISLAWTFIKLMLQKDDAKAFIPTMAMQILTLGFFYYLVDHGTEIAQMVISSFEASASRVGGSGGLDPSLVVQSGFDCVFIIMDKISEAGFTETFAVVLPLVIAGIILLLAHVGIAILFLVTLIESYFVLYAGVIMLGFGALPWTREIPKNYLIYAINVGVKLFVLYLVVGVGIEFSQAWPRMLQGPASDIVISTLYIMSAALVFLAVAWKVPGIAAALTSGALNFNASDAMGMTAAAAGVGAAAGAVATGGASTLLAATQGAMQATTSGMSLASEKGASGAAAMLKGLGNAAGAVASEAGSAIKSGVGLKPPSDHATDGRGRGVSNLGTRAANNLQSQIQGEREAKAAAPAVPAVSEPPAPDNADTKEGNTPNLPAETDRGGLGTLTTDATAAAGGPVGGGMEPDRLADHRAANPALYEKGANGAEKFQPWERGSGEEHKYDQNGMFIEDQSKWGDRLAAAPSSAPSVAPGATGAAPAAPASAPSSSASPSSAPPSAESMFPADSPTQHTDAPASGRLKAPSLPPPDTAQGGVSINLVVDE